jgi:uncharacterized protein YjbI with pentapeptide repeats
VIANTEHIQVLKKGVEEWNEWREKYPEIRPDLNLAPLNDAQLAGANLSGASLCAVNLSGNDLTGADFSGADLRRTDLSGAKLQNVNFTDANLRDAILRDTDLTVVKGLTEVQLGGTDLLRAKLPPDIDKFKALETVEELSKNASTLFFSILVTGAFILLTIARTEDAQLLTNAGSAKLPLLETDIPLNWFYIIAPLILLSLYTYFHLYLLRLWETLVALPAIFPNGRRQDEQTYPWLLNDLVSTYLYNLRDRHPRLYALQRISYIFLAWWLTPMLVLPFWVRYLTRHDWPTSLLHVFLLVLSISIGQLFYRHAKSIFKKGSFCTYSRKNYSKHKSVLLNGASIISLFTFFMLLSYGSISGVPYNRLAGSENKFFVLVPKALSYLGIQPFADLRMVDVSYRGGWSGKAEDIESVRGAYLQGANLRYADGWRAFLVKSNLHDANLEKAILIRADLRMAELVEANLQYCILVEADLSGAELYEANMMNARLDNAILERAKLHYTNLESANLRNANLAKADLRHANLSNAILEGAELTGAIYDTETRWGTFDPTTHGVKLVPSDNPNIEIESNKADLSASDTLPNSVH